MKQKQLERAREIEEELKELKKNEKEREVTIHDGRNIKVEYNPNYKRLKKELQEIKDNWKDDCGRYWLNIDLQNIKCEFGSRCSICLEQNKEFKEICERCLK